MAVNCPYIKSKFLLWPCLRLPCFPRKGQGCWDVTRNRAQQANRTTVLGAEGPLTPLHLFPVLLAVFLIVPLAAAFVQRPLAPGWPQVAGKPLCRDHTEEGKVLPHVPCHGKLSSLSRLLLFTVNQSLVEDGLGV